MLDWVVSSFSRGSSRPRNQTWVFCIAGRFFVNWDMGEAHCYQLWEQHQFHCTSPSELLGFQAHCQSSSNFFERFFFFFFWAVAITSGLKMFGKKVKVKSLSRVWLFATPWTVAYQAPLSMGFSRQGYWNGLPFPSPEDLPNPGIEPRPPAFQADALTSETPGNHILNRCAVI